MLRCSDVNCDTYFYRKQPGATEDCSCGRPLEAFSMYQPKGFMTDRRPRDFDGRDKVAPLYLPLF